MNNTQLDFTKLKPASYARKSSESEDKQMLSIISQIEEFERIASFYKLPKLVKSFEEAKSAKKEFNRPEFSELIAMIKKGSVDAIVCWKLDRLARNMTEGGMLIDLLSSGVLKAIITHDKVYYPSDNVLLMSVEFGQGKQFVKDLSVNVKRGQTKKASMGVPHGVASLGFLNDKTEEKGNRKWLADKPRLDSIKILLDMFLTGTYSAGKLHQFAINELQLTTVNRKRCGGKLITHSRIYEILKDPIYAGFFFYGNERYELDKNLPRLITEAQHEKIKQILGKRHIPKVQNHTTTYSGFIKSETGDFIGQDITAQVICDCKHKFAHRSKTHCPKCGIAIDQMMQPKYLNYAHYYNVRKKKAKVPYNSIEISKVDEYIKNLFLENVAFSQTLIDWSVTYIHEMKDYEITKKITLSQRKEERIAELQVKKAKSRALLRDEKITTEEYNEDIKMLEEEYADIHRPVESVDWYSRLNEVKDITAEIINVFESDNVQAKRNILSKLGSNLVWDDEKLFIYNTDEINALINGVKSIKLKFPEFEPKLFPYKQGGNEKIPSENEIFSMMLRG